MSTIHEIWPYTINLGAESPTYQVYILSPRQSPVTEWVSEAWSMAACTSLFELTDDRSPFVVKLFEICPSRMDVDHESILANTLHGFIEAGALYVWCMFDGVYCDSSRIFDSWHLMNTYAVISADSPLRFAFSEEERKGTSWAEYVSRIRAEVESHLLDYRFSVESKIA